jgi:hypothetical protein
MNSNGGFYQHGKLYCMDTKLFVATKFLEHNERLGGSRPVLTEVAAECHVGRDFLAKIERELIENKQVLPLEEFFLGWDNPIGPGSKSMSGEDFYVLYILHQQEPTRLLKSYVYKLYYYTGMIMLANTVLRWFGNAFPILGRLRVPNLVPYNKF